MSTTGAHQILAGRFRIESVIGKGGMGAVYAATDMSIGRRVAVKMLHPELAVEVDNLERMREEAFSLASIHHPNIVQLYDFHAGGPHATFMVMELVEGETLSARLKRIPSFPVAVAVDYAHQILSALSAAHEKGIVHRDIKPGNLLIVSVPARHDLVKVLDFGIAKLTEMTIRRRPTTAGILLGTPTYMSPEQTTGGSVDPRTDVYAVGLVLYRMLSGTNPFDGYDLATTLHRVTSFVPPELGSFRGDVPAHVAQAVARALAKDPAQRFPTAIDFAKALGGSQAIVVRDPNAATLSARVSAPNSAPVSIAHPQSPSGSRRGGLLVAMGVGLLALLLVTLSGAVVWLLAKQGDAAPAPAEGAPSTTTTTPSAAPSATPSASSSAERAANVPRTTPSTASSGKVTASSGLGGNCSCLPNVGVLNHGSNVRLAPAPLPIQCFCDDFGTPLCQHPITPCDAQANCDRTCRQPTLVSTPNAPCQGHTVRGVLKAGTIRNCQFDTKAADQYAGPTGRACKGLTVMGERVDGTVFCAR